ncbi:hypothetical protein M9H77_10635 [Catharanthus roseus]|uniref:Uncharacterized protein n=1 Tax=Catharanthus roseus TaxID=4058 RepID=A0ACC0BCA6_CATRO|nr:hypothetical protein M9H77_10635 [Catharanthus roseus]
MENIRNWIDLNLWHMSLHSLNVAPWKTTFLTVIHEMCYRRNKQIAYLLSFIPLTHLRHLVMKDLDLNLLPPSMVNLQNSEVLVVGWVEEVFIPGTVWKMKKLRYWMFVVQ